METRGQRIFPNKYGFLRLPEGGYGQDMSGRWWVRPPGANAMIIEPHFVLVHTDQSISISDTVRVDGQFCGSLKRGTWKRSES